MIRRSLASEQTLRVGQQLLLQIPGPAWYEDNLFVLKYEDVSGNAYDSIFVYHVSRFVSDRGR
jgi:hypothetical protein